MKTKHYYLLILCFISFQMIGQNINILKDIYSGAQPSNPINFNKFNNKLIFQAESADPQSKIYISDGTESGTVILKEGLKDGRPNSGIEFNNKFYFAASFGTLGQELWVTDGTINGTEIIKDIHDGYFLGSLGAETEMIEFQGKIFFTADNGINGQELWTTEGTTETTFLFKDINPGSEGASIEHLTIFNGKLYFSADDSDRGKELWVSDGTPENTNIVKDIKPGNSGSNITDLITFQNKLYFVADSQYGRELWATTNGTSATTTIVKDLKSGSNGSYPSDLIIFKDRLYFKANINDGFQIFKSDGTEDGTGFFKTIEPNGSSINLKDGVELNDKYYFAAGPQFTSGNELWIFETIEEGVEISKIKEIYEGPNAGISNPKLVVYNNLIFFQGNDGTTGEELWKSNGTEAGTVLVADMNTENDFKPEYFNVLGDKLLFVAENQTLGKELHFYGETIVDNGDRTLIPDPYFETALRELGLDDSDTNNGYVLTEDINTISNLFIKNKNINSLEGIQDFTSLQHLNTSENSLTSLDLSNIQNLITLDIKTNNLTSLKINVGNLQELHLENNTNLTCVDVDDINVIQNFVFNDDLGLHTKDDQTSFSENCSTSSLTTNVPDDAFEQFLIDNGYDEGDLDNQVLTANINTVNTLDLSNLGIENLTGIEDFEALQELILDGNTNLTFNLSQNFNLTKLSLNSMGLNEFESFNYNFLQELSINNNNLNALDTNSLYQITHLDCSSNQITSLELFSLFQLEELICNNNNIEELDVTGINSLTKFYAQDNSLSKIILKTGNTQNITEFNATNNPDLECIEVEAANLDFANTNFTNIDSQTSFNVNCGDTRTVDIPDNAFEQYLIERDLDDALDNKVLLSNIEDVTYLFAYDRGITNLEGIQHFTALRDLDLTDNLISFLDLKNNNNLETISLTNNKLHTLKLNVSNLSTLRIDNNPRLTCVEVDNVNIANSFNFTENGNFNKDSQTEFSENCLSLYTYIPDDNFEQYLIDNGIDTDETLDDYVLTANINQIEDLAMVARGIKDLTGIEDFDALVTLDVSANLLTEIVLSNRNSNLETIDVNSNQLTTLDTWSSSIKDVNADYNNLTTIKVSRSTKKLGLKSNKFTSFNVSNLSLVYLEELDLRGNNELLEINLDGMISLISLDASFCNLSTIELSGKNNLKKLDVRNNNIIELNLALLFDLEELQCRDNEMEVLTLDHNTANDLKTLDCSFNNLTTLDISETENLETLLVNDNNLSSLNLKISSENLPKLTDFASVRNTNLTCIDVIDVDYATENYTVIDNHTNFYYNCNFFGGDYVYMPDDNFESKFDNTIDDFVLKSIIENRETLSLSLNNTETIKIEDLTGIEAFTSLKSLSFSNNSIKNVDLSENLLLETIIAQRSEIESVILPETTTLIEVDFYNNNLTSFNVSSLPNLERLLLSGNKLTTIDLSSNIKLEEFQIASNEIENIDVSNNTNLKKLELSFMGMNTFLGLKSINLSNNRNLEELGLRGNNLTTLDLTNNIRLKDFEARSNNLSCINVWDVDYANQNWSENIDNEASFGDNCYIRIADENFERGLINNNFDTVLDGYILASTANSIETLQLASLNIVDLSGLEEFTSLKVLNIDNNLLTSIDLTNNTQLNSLIIRNNPELDRLDLSQNTSLNSLIANNNNITCIKVWDVDYANTNWSKGIDDEATFSLDCNDVWTIDVDEKTQSILESIAGLDANNDGNITIAEAEAFADELDLSDKNLNTVEGLQAFSRVKKLNLSGNNIDDLSPLTRKKISLISKTSGKKREVATKTSELETLIISNNSFETLNLEELKNLKALDLSNNPNVVTISIKNGYNANITSFNATNTPNLTCIMVDDTSANYLLDFKKDTKSNFVADLDECRSTVLSTENFVLNDVKIFPNPVTNFLTIESSREFEYAEIYNTIGKKVLKTQATKIDFSNYTSGIYLVRIISENNVITKRVLKK
ncbi:ELWxxDGT repeat protein [Polaribacter sp. Asnod6-C07]|uniref:ELWxxDGT repeat protein n=1 Tax=Polaribacter sp. Asnod6-C07 TaxID=3160582 RepID=UPI003865E0FB